MEYRRLGNTGLHVSVLSYGAWVTFGNQFQVPKAKELMSACREAGVNFFDNAEVYASGAAEEIMGQAIKELGWKRSDLVISTKIFWGGPGPNDKGLSRKHLIEGTDASLKRLGMDYVDLLFCHRPDPNTPIEETVRAMNHLIDHGKVFYWGTSEWSAAELEEAWDVADRLGMVGPAFEQPEYNIFKRDRVEREYVPLYDRCGLGLTTWSPLASGILTGKYSGGEIPEGSRLSLDSYKGLRDRKLVEKRHELEAVDRLKPLTEELDCSLAQLALAWCAHNPKVSTVVTGATKVEQIKENMKALDVLPKLKPEHIEFVSGVADHVASYRPR